MKRFLRYVVYRELYRSLRKAMDSSGGTDKQSTSQRNAPQQSMSARQPAEHSSMSAQREVINSNPNIPTEGSTIETPAQLKAVLQEMDPYEFEYFVGDLWERMGWETTVSTASADKGVDITARKSSPYDQLLLIQAKRYGPNTTVGSPEIQQYASLRNQFDGVDKVLLVTTNAYSRQAREIATDLNVKLINGDELVELIHEHDSLDLVAKYLDFIHPVEESESDSESDEPPTGVSDGTLEAETESSSTPTDSSTEDQPVDDHSGAVPSIRWRNAILGASLGWLVVFFGVTTIPEGLWGLLFFGTWLGLPAAIYLDTRVLTGYTEWPKYRWLYVLSSSVWFVGFIPGLIYLWRRRSRMDAGS